MIFQMSLKAKVTNRSPTVFAHGGIDSHSMLAFFIFCQVNLPLLNILRHRPAIPKNVPTVTILYRMNSDINTYSSLNLDTSLKNIWMMADSLQVISLNTDNTLPNLQGLGKPSPWQTVLILLAVVSSGIL